MAKLYYGNGECEIEASENIKGVEIRYRGDVSISGANNETRLTLNQNNKIIVVSLNEQLLKKLFTYTGELKIISVIVADSNAKKVTTSIHRVMDYSELLNSKAEDMTEIKVEDLKAGHSHGKKRRVEPRQILHSLNTSRHNASLYLADGTLYDGDFHIHLSDNAAMTGKTHIKSSQDLYYSNGKSTRTPDLVPPGVVEQKKRKRQFKIKNRLSRGNRRRR